MNVPARDLPFWVVFAVGLLLLVAGVVTGVHGATVIGMIVAAVGLAGWLKRPRQALEASGGRS